MIRTLVELAVVVAAVVEVAVLWASLHTCLTSAATGSTHYRKRPKMAGESQEKSKLTARTHHSVRLMRTAHELAHALTGAEYGSSHFRSPAGNIYMPSLLAVIPV